MTTRIHACVEGSRALRPHDLHSPTIWPVTDHPSLENFARIVVKVGSSLLVDRVRGALKQEWLDALVADIAALHRRGADVMVVSSGAIALGRTIAGLPKGALKLEDSQAAAAIGQIALARAWSQALHGHGIVAGQVLLTLYDTEERRRYLNARETLGPLWRQRSARRTRRHHGERRSLGAAIRRRGSL
jgi:glutamate 5-kinase